jgi:hypothetical protein
MFTVLLVLALHARSVAELEELYYETPEATVDGIVCGLCSRHERHPDGTRVSVRHASVDHVAYCYSLYYQIEAESADERAAELANERYFEERGAQDDPRERELWAMEDYLRGL